MKAEQLSFSFTPKKRGANYYLFVCFQQSVKGSQPNRKWRSLEPKLVDSNLRYWNKSRQRFNNYQYSTSNNQVLLDIETRCNNYLATSSNASLNGLADFYDSDREDIKHAEAITFESFLLDVIKEEKENSAGCNFENYEKLLRRLKEFDPELRSRSFREVDLVYCDKFAKWLIKVRKGAAYKNLTKNFRSTFNKAVKAGLCSKSQIIDLDFNSYKVSKGLTNKAESTSQHALSISQTHRLLNLDLGKYIKTERDRVEVPFMYDLVLFMLFTFVAPCVYILPEKYPI